MSQPYLEIASQGYLVRIEPIRLLYPKSSDVDDRAMIQSKVTAKAGSIGGEFLATFMTVDFEMLKRQFRKLDNDFNAPVSFESLEQQLTIKKLTNDNLGHFDFQCEIMPEGDTECTLTFSINIDQSYIMGYVIQLEQITEAFPMENSFLLDE